MKKYDGDEQHAVTCSRQPYAGHTLNDYKVTEKFEKRKVWRQSCRALP